MRGSGLGMVVAAVIVAAGALIWAWRAAPPGTHASQTEGAGRDRLHSEQQVPTARTRLGKDALREGGVLRGERRHTPPKLPAPKLTPRPPEVNPTDAPALPLVNQVLLGRATNRVVLAQLDFYLQANQRNAASLLAAASVCAESRPGADLDILREAVQAFPDDPRVLLDWLLWGDAPPAERRQALDAFVQAAPQNALADYLSALDHFDSGDVEAALRSLMSAYGKTGIDDYFTAAVQGRQEAYRAAGYSEAEAAAAAFCEMGMPQNACLLKLSQCLNDLRQQYVQATDSESAQFIAEMCVRLGWQVQSGMGNTLVGEALGMRIEREALEHLPPDAVLTATGSTVRERLSEIAEWRRALKDVQPGDQLVSTLDESAVTELFERIRLNGEREAFRWLLDTHGSREAAW